MYGIINESFQLTIIQTIGMVMNRSANQQQPLALTKIIFIFQKQNKIVVTMTDRVPNPGAQVVVLSTSGAVI